jgi:hypothetical protein
MRYDTAKRSIVDTRHCPLLIVTANKPNRMLELKMKSYTQFFFLNVTLYESTYHSHRVPDRRWSELHRTAYKRTGIAPPATSSLSPKPTGWLTQAG